MGKLRRKIIGKGFPIFALKIYVILNWVTFFPFLVKSHLCSFHFSRNIYGKRGLEQKDLMILSPCWKFSLVGENSSQKGSWLGTQRGWKLHEEKKNSFPKQCVLHSEHNHTFRNVWLSSHLLHCSGESVRIDLPRASLSLGKRPSESNTCPMLLFFLAFLPGGIHPVTVPEKMPWVCTVLWSGYGDGDNS